jgi:hypothetical protein
MHATADTTEVKFPLGAGRRVMRGVRRLMAEHEDKGMQAESRGRKTVALGGRVVVWFPSS